MITLRSFVKPPVRLGVLLGLTLTLSGCLSEDYYAHSDLISHDAGDANAANEAVQTINPWPKNARNPDLDTDGKRAALAMQRYQDGKVPAPHSLNTATGGDVPDNGGQFSAAAVQK